MKNTDIAAIILIASLSILTAYFVADAVIGRPGNESVKVKTVDSISSDVTAPEPSVFNKDAINPTVEVLIGGSDKAATPSADQNGAQSTTKQ